MTKGIVLARMYDREGTGSASNSQGIQVSPPYQLAYPRRNCLHLFRALDADRTLSGEAEAMQFSLVLSSLRLKA